MNEIIFAIRNSRISFKVREHKTDAGQVVIKSRDPEVGALVAFGAEVDVLEQKKGSRYHLTFLNKDAFMANFGALVVKLQSGALALVTKPELKVIDSIEEASDEYDNDTDED